MRSRRRAGYQTHMPDDDLHALELEWRRTGEVELGARWLEARLRAGSLSRDRLTWAAALGDPAARRALPQAWSVRSVSDLGRVALDHAERVRVYRLMIDALPARSGSGLVRNLPRTFGKFHDHGQTSDPARAEALAGGSFDARPLDEPLVVVAVRRALAAFALGEPTPAADRYLTPEVLAKALSVTRGRPVSPAPLLVGWLPTRAGGWPRRFALVVARDVDHHALDLCAWDGRTIIDLRDGDRAVALGSLLRAEAPLTAADADDAAFVAARVLLDEGDDPHVIVGHAGDLRSFQEDVGPFITADPAHPPPTGYEVDEEALRAVSALARPRLEIGTDGASLELCALAAWTRPVGPRLMRHVLTLDRRSNVSLSSTTLVEAAFARVPVRSGPPNPWP